MFCEEDTAFTTIPAAQSNTRAGGDLDLDGPETEDDRMTDNPEDDRARGYRDGYHKRICAFTNNKEYVRGWFEGKKHFGLNYRRSLMPRLVRDSRTCVRRSPSYATVRTSILGALLKNRRGTVEPTAQAGDRKSEHGIE
jgi:hypothetical protein